MSEKEFKCSFCNYVSTRRFNILRHETAKHSKEVLQLFNNDECNKKDEKPIINDKNLITTLKTTIPEIKIDIQKVKIDIQNDKIDINNQNNKKTIVKNLNCSKCLKKYSNTKSLIKHEENCKGINKLTCPKCMHLFTSYGNKSRHIKNNNCKPKSIIYALHQNKQENQKENENTTIINNNITNNIITNYNTIIINNYGSERVDYLTNDDMMKILTMGPMKTIPNYIERKHFDKNFPENHNILYDNKSKICKIKENNTWKDTNVALVSSKIIDDNSNILLSYFLHNKDILFKKIQNEEICDFIIEKLTIIKQKTNKNYYNNLFNIIKSLIENSTTILK